MHQREKKGQEGALNLQAGKKRTFILFNMNEDERGQRSEVIGSAVAIASLPLNGTVLDSLSSLSAGTINAWMNEPPPTPLPSAWRH
jgi:hypothetical protein